MKFFKAENVACYICGGSKDIKFLDFEPNDNFGSVHSHLQQVGMCKNCRQKLARAIQDTDKSKNDSKSWEDWICIAKTMSPDQFMQKYLETPEERILFMVFWLGKQSPFSTENFGVLASVYDVKVLDLKKAFASLKKRNLIYAVKDMPGYYGADLEFK